MGGRRRRTPTSAARAERTGHRAEASGPRRPPPHDQRAKRHALLRVRTGQIVLVAAVAFAVYANTLANGFLNDDEHEVLLNPWIRDARSIPTIFSSNSWGFIEGSKTVQYYRPLKLVFFLITYHLCGLRAWGFHLVNVLFHVANALLVLLLTARLIQRAGAPEHVSRRQWPKMLLSAPFVAAVLFATHPIHTEAVAWVAAVSEVSFTCFFLLSLYLYVAQNDPRPARLAPSVTCFALAMLCKETAVTLPAVLVAYDLALGGREESWRQRLARYAPYLLMAALYLIARWAALARMQVAPGRIWELSPLELAINVLPLFASYIGKLLLPVSLTFRPSFDPIQSLLSGRGLGALIVTAAFLWAAERAWKRDRLTFFGLALFLIPLAPAFLIHALPGTPFAERYAYLPSVGFVVLVALYLARASTVWGVSVAAVVALILTTTLYSVGTITRNRVWRDAYTLFVDTASKVPNAPRPPYNLAVALLNGGHVDEATAHLRILVDSEPKNGQYHSALGSALLTKGRTNEALEHLRTAAALDPASRESRNDLAIALRRTGHVHEAIEQYRQALTIDPGYADAHFNLGGALADAGQLDEGITHYRAAVRLTPENAYYRSVLGIELAKQGLLDEAIVQFQEAVRLAPSEPAYTRNLQRALDLKRSGQASPDAAP